MVALSVWAVAVPSLSQETVTTRDGRRVTLNPDGTWQYIKDSATNATASAIETVRAYFAASSWRDRLTFVLNPDQMRAVMEERYGEKVLGKDKSRVITADEPKPNEAGWVMVDVEVSTHYLKYYLKMTPEGYRIDWIASTGYNRTSVEEFLATRPTTPVRMCVLAKLSDYYNFEFTDAKDIAWSIGISDSRGKMLGYGFAEKKTPRGERLLSTLRDGKEHQLVVDIQCLPNASDASVFVISNLLAVDSWWYVESDRSVQRSGGQAR